MKQSTYFMCYFNSIFEASTSLQKEGLDPNKGSNQQQVKM